MKIKEEINKMIIEGRKSEKFPDKLCIIMNPDFIELFRLDETELLEPITPYNLVDLLIWEDPKYIDSMINRMVMIEDVGFDRIKESINIAQAFQMIKFK